MNDNDTAIAIGNLLPSVRLPRPEVAADVRSEFVQLHEALLDQQLKRELESLARRRYKPLIDSIGPQLTEDDGKLVKLVEAGRRKIPQLTFSEISLPRKYNPTPQQDLTVCTRMQTFQPPYFFGNPTVEDFDVLQNNPN